MTRKQALRQAKALARLRAKHPSPFRQPFPDLSVPAGYPSLGGFGNPTPKRASPPAPTTLTVSLLHKSSYQVLSRDEVQYAGRKV